MANTNNLIIPLLLLGFVHLSWSRILLNEGKDCWDECEKQTGECKFCGSGSCCRKGYLTSYFSGCSVSNGCQNKHCCTKYAQDINECESNPCVHGSCTDGVNSYTCQCEPG